jgi:hypothetical protein
MELVTMRRLMKSACSVLTLAGVLTVGSAFGQEPGAKAGKAVNKGATVVAAEASALPECLEKLKLSAEQQEQVKAISQKSDQSLAMVWKQFGDRYMQTIKLESSMLAAIEDNLTEEQRMQVRDERRKTAQQEIAPAGAANKKHSQAAEKEIAAAGVTLTHEQEMAADKVHQKYRDQLRMMNHDIHGLHARLVSIEADKLVEIEKVLTKDQLAQLRMSRQMPPAGAKVEVTETEDKKAE